MGLQDAIELCLTSEGRKLKELVVALEWSENHDVLQEIFKFVEQAAKKIGLENDFQPTEKGVTTDEMKGEAVSDDVFIPETEPQVNFSQAPTHALAQVPQDIFEADPQLESSGQPDTEVGMATVPVVVPVK